MYNGDTDIPSVLSSLWVTGDDEDLNKGVDMAGSFLSDPSVAFDGAAVA